MKKLCETLAQTELFAGLDHDTFNRFCTRVNIRLAWKGEVIVNEGDPATVLYTVVSGQVAMQKYAANGDFVTLDLLGPGDIFGEDLVFGDEKNWTLTAEAVSNAKVLTLSHDILLALLAEKPEMMERFAGVLSARIRRHDKRIIILSQRNLRAKISSYLLDLLDLQLEEDEKEALPGKKTYISTPSVELPVSKEVAARLLAMPRPSFSRELVRMEKDGLIRVSGRVIWLTNLEGLEHGLDDYE